MNFLTPHFEVKIFTFKNSLALLNKCMPLLDWLNDRGYGIFLHVSFLPNNQGIGCFGDSAKKLVDMLSISRLKIWWIFPVSPSEYDDSPY